MRYYKYKLIDLLKEESSNQDTKNVSEEKLTQGDYNSKQVANILATTVKSHADAQAKFKAKNLSATGKVKVKAGKNVSIAGEAELDFKTGKADISVPIKIKNKEVNFNIQGLNVSNPKDIYGKEINGSFIDPESNKQITVGVIIDPTSDKYSFTAGKMKDKFSFDVGLNIDKSQITTTGKLGFDTKDFISSKFAPKAEVGVQYDNMGGLEGSITGTKNIKTRTGNVEISATGSAGSSKKSAALGLKYTPDNKTKKSSLEKKAAKQLKKYAEFDTVSKDIKLKKDKKGDVKLKKDTESVAKKLKINENKVIMTKKELKFLIKNMSKILEV